MDNLDFERYYKKGGFASQRRYPNEQLIQFLAEHFFVIPKEKRKKIKLLEVGCGSGANLWMIAKEGFDAYGIDIAPTSIDLCKKMLRYWGVKAHVQTGNMRKLPFNDNFFDAVADVLSVEHTDLKGHTEAYREIFRCLKKGGRFFSWHLGTNSANFRNGGGRKLDRLTIDNAPNPSVPYSNNGLTCFLNPTTARTMLFSAGFRDIKIELVVRTYKNMTQKVEYFSIQAFRP